MIDIDTLYRKNHSFSNYVRSRKMAVHHRAHTRPFGEAMANFHESRAAKFEIEFPDFPQMFEDYTAWKTE